MVITIIEHLQIVKSNGLAPINAHFYSLNPKYNRKVQQEKLYRAATNHQQSVWAVEF